MKYIEIDKLKIGMILGEDIYDKNGLLFASKDTVIDKENLVKLSNFDLEFLMIKNENQNVGSDDEYENLLSIVMETIASYKLFGKNDINGVKKYASDLINLALLDNDVFSILKKISEIDAYTISHSLRVSILSGLIAKWLGLDKTKIRDAIIAGLFHQAGKLGIEKEILLKKETLSNDELQIVKNYTIYTTIFLNNKDWFSRDVITAIEHSNERCDGSGLPEGLQDSKIHPLAKIIAVANVFDAATNDKCYKDAISPFDISSELFSDSLQKLSPQVTTPIIKAIESSYIGMKVELSNGEVGKIVFLNKLDSKRPLVQVGEKIYDLSMGKEKLKITKMISIDKDE